MTKTSVGRFARPALVALGALALTAGAPAAAAGPASVNAAVVGVRGSVNIDDFYARRDGRPLWFAQAGNSDAPARLLSYLSSAEVDGVSSDRYTLARIDQALRSAWGGDPDAVRAADRLLSEAFVAYVGDIRRAPSVKIEWIDHELQPSMLAPYSLLSEVAAADDINSYVAAMGWMNPLYARLRQAALDSAGATPAERALVRLNLDRARVLPASGRYVVVNAADAKLSMFEGGREIDTMRVVVGKPINPTPMMAAYIRYASLNPYWNVPTDLAAERIAPNVLKDGLGYLKAQGYEVLSNWTDEASIVDPASVDWQAVADGRAQVRIRQLPGRNNSMGLMKFMFPNAQGVYLHDTPQKELLGQDSRLFSGGCVRLEDAARLGRWLYGRDLHATSNTPELRVDLDRPVPVFLTYITAVPSDTGVTFLPDVYRRDAQALASAGAGSARVAGL